MCVRRRDLAPEPSFCAGWDENVMSGRSILVPPVDVRVAEVAARQEGMISTEQLLGLGIGRSGIHERVRRGRLHPYYRRVYSVGHTRLTPRARLWAAILACGGPGVAVIGHRTAAALWDLIPMPGGPVEVSTLRRRLSGLVCVGPGRLVGG